MLQTLYTEDDMLALVPWLVFLHILSALTFFLAHGTSVAMAFKIRTETDFSRIRAMLDLSASTIGIMFFLFLAMGLTGLIMPFILKLWGKGWIWISIVLMVVVLVQMGLMNEKRYKTLRRLVGLPYMQGNKEYPAEEPASLQEVHEHMKKLRVEELVIVGYIIPMAVLRLMVFKPF
jgi:small-conductance mechanosensitive channel